MADNQTPESNPRLRCYYATRCMFVGVSSIASLNTTMHGLVHLLYGSNFDNVCRCQCCYTDWMNRLFRTAHKELLCMSFSDDSKPAVQKSKPFLVLQSMDSMV